MMGCVAVTKKNNAENLAVEYKLRTFAFAIVLWCNGSTTVFGSVCGGSNPPGTTEKALLFLRSKAFSIYTSVRST